MYATQLANLPGIYNPLLTAAKATAQGSLSGYGGITWLPDDPNTAQREDLAPSFNPNAKLGQKEKNAVDAQRWAANARGDMFSSFANKNIGSALVQLNEEKRNIINNFASSIASIMSQQALQATNIITDWTKLFGSDAMWLVENPPPAPPAPPPPPEPAAAPAPPTATQMLGRDARTWTGTSAPKISTLTSAWGVPASRIRVEHRDGRYVAYIVGG